MKATLKAVIFSFLALLTACNQDQSQQETSVQRDAAENAANTQSPRAVDIGRGIERKIIKEGRIDFETADAEGTRKLLTRTVTECNGYVAQENVFDRDGQTRHEMTVRIPTDRFDYFLEKISANIQNLESKSVSARDVTEEYVDVEARMRTKKELENRYLQLLQRADRVTDVLAIEKEMGTLRAEIESIEGRLRYLKDRVAFSSLTVAYYERTASPFGFSTRFGQALGSGWTYLLAFLIALTSLWPFFLLGIAAYFLVRRFRKRKTDV